MKNTTEKQLLRRATAVHRDMLKQAEKFGVSASEYDGTKLLHTSDSGKVKVLIDATERLAIAIAKRRRIIICEK